MDDARRDYFMRLAIEAGRVGGPLGISASATIRHGPLDLALDAACAAYEDGLEAALWG